MTKLMTQILQNNINDLQTPLYEINKLLKVYENDIPTIVNIIESIKEDKLYKSVIHGLHHSQKVFLFAYLISKHVGLNEVDMQIIIDAALYHDIRRENDFEDSLHGYASALKIHSVVDSDIYKDSTNLQLLRAIVDIHSQNDKKALMNFENYELDSNQFSRYEILYSILKDADALDRARFSEKSMAALKPEFLRFDFSKDLIPLAREINAVYYEIIERQQKEHEIDITKKGSCFHSISFDFFKLSSILSNGILSVSEMKKRGLNVPRNFEGGNLNKWISVVDVSLIKYHYSGYENFTQHGISFLCEVPEMVMPINNNRKTDAIYNGLPFDKSGHLDEKYVYKQIPTENIICILIPEKYLHTDIRTLSYLYNSLSLEILAEKINYFLEKIVSSGIKIFDSQEFKQRDFENLLIEYKRILDSTICQLPSEQGKPNAEIQINLDNVLVKLNRFIQNAMYKYYQKKLDKNPNEGINVFDVVELEIQESEIEYEKVIGDSDALFMLNRQKEKTLTKNNFSTCY